MSGEQPVKKRSNKPVISNSKARGVMVLIGALLVFQVVTFLAELWLTEKDAPKKNLAGRGAERPRSAQAVVSGGVDDGGAAASFSFDPNTITADSLVLLGFSPKQARVVMNYREKGGRFRKKEDFARMYVVSEEKYEALKERIVIREAIAQVPEKPERNSGQRKELRTDLQAGGVDTLYGKKRSQRDSAAFRKPWRCDLNRADSAALVKLYGIGPYFARKILRYRERLGGWFVQAEQLLEIDGLERERFEGLREKLLVDTTGMRKFRLDTLGKAFMEKHPYIGPYAARGILLYRESRGTGEKVELEDLIREHILSKEDAARLKKYVKQ